MERLRQTFKKIGNLEPPTNLEMLILEQIKNIKAENIRQQLMLSYTYLSGSILAVFWAFLTFGQAILKSEFWGVISLAWTDAGIVFSNWNDFFYSALETFPTLALAIILLPVFLAILSINSHLKLNKNKFKHVHPGAYAQ